MKQFMAGLKYSKKEDGKVVRILRWNDEKIFLSMEGSSGILEMKKEVFLEKYIMLLPHAFVNIMITDTDVEDTNMEVQPDFYICINRSSDVNNKVNSPCLIYRQNVYSSLNNEKLGGNNLFMGEYEYTQDPANAPLNHLMVFKKIDFTYQIAVYMDDTSNDILKFINPKAKKVINSALTIMKESLQKKADIVKMKLYGCHTNIIELMTDINFDTGFRAIFGIFQVNWSVELDNNVTNDGTITFTNKQKKFIEDMIKGTVKDIKVIKYDPDEVITFKRNHIVISDKTKQIYFIEYDVLKMY